MNIIKLFIFLLVIIANSVFAEENLSCLNVTNYRGKQYQIWKTLNTLVSVTELSGFNYETVDNEWLWINDKEINAIAPNAFKNITINYLHINLTDGELQITPESFNGLLNLEYLVISSSIVTLSPDLFKSLVYLKNLQIKIRGAEKVFREIFDDIKKVNSLSIVDSNLGNIDNTSFIVNFHPTIFILRLEQSNITVIKSQAFSGLKNLSELDLYENNLETIERGAFIGLLNLKIIRINEPRLISISEGIFNGLNALTNLQFDYSGISHINANAFAGLNLQILKFSKNNLSHLENGIFNGLDELVYLFLDQNNITHLPKNIFNGLKKLNHLYINNNQIKEIDTGAFTNLNFTKLNLNFNKLSTIKTGSFEGFTAKCLLLSHNNISTIEDKAFENSTVRNIYVNSNNISFVNKTTWGLPESTYIGISDDDLPSYDIYTAAYYVEL